MTTSAKLVTLLKCAQAWEAEIVRDRLMAAGIQAFVQGSESATSLSYVGTALGGVKVQVPEDAVDHARRLMAEDERQRATAGPWNCPRCGEPNEAAFDFCYSCSMPRDGTPATKVSGDQDVEPKPTQSADPDPQAWRLPSQMMAERDEAMADDSASWGQQDVRSAAYTDSRSVGSEPADWSNEAIDSPATDRFPSPRFGAKSDADGDFGAAPSQIAIARSLVDRATRWAVLCIVIPLPLFPLISMGLLVQSGTIQGRMSGFLRIAVVALWCFDLLLLAASVWLIWELVVYLPSLF
jgi:hypothetical protein